MKKPYIMESSLFERVAKYMEEKTIMDIEVMTEYLIQNYNDFRHKKKKPFMQSVQKVYNYEKFMRKTLDKESNQSSDELIEIDKNGEDTDIVEVPVKKTKLHKKNTDNSVDNLYKSASTISNNTETPNSAKSSKRKREAVDLDSIIVDHIKNKKKKTNIEKLTFKYDPSSFLGLEYFPFEVGTIPAILSGEDWPLSKSILFTGPTGSGKSMLIEYFAGMCEVPLLRVSALSPSSGPGGSGTSVMEEALAEAYANAPCILHISNIDDISKKDSGSSRGADKRTCDQIANVIEEVNRSDKTVLLIAEARMPEQLDSILLDRFEDVINFPILCKEAKLLIIKKLCEKQKLDIEDINLSDIVERTSSFVAGDLKKLVKTASKMAWKRDARSLLSKDVANVHSSKENIGEYMCKVFKPERKRKASAEDFYTALLMVKPTLKREGFPSPSDTKWDDVGGLENIKDQILLKVVNAIKYKEGYAKLGVTDPKGILMYGPPGCGKTMLAEAVANEAGVNLLSVRGPELLNMYQGESERGIREVFGKAASVAPCIIFFDEFDGLCQNRVKSMDSGSRHTIVNTLLAEMNGFGGRKEVYVIAATNIPEVVDPAILRPGRIDLTLYVGLPDLKERSAILKALSRKKGVHLGSDVDFDEISELCKNFSGADCKSLVQTACEAVLRELHPKGNLAGLEIGDKEVCKRHFKIARQQVAPSVTPEAQEKFLKMKHKMEFLMKGGENIS